jgi:hypothetical protein
MVSSWATMVVEIHNLLIHWKRLHSPMIPIFLLKFCYLLKFQWTLRLLIFKVLFFYLGIFDNETINWCQILLLVWLNSLSTYAMLAIVVIIWIGEIRSYDFRKLVYNWCNKLAYTIMHCPTYKWIHLPFHCQRSMAEMMFWICCPFSFMTILTLKL